MAHGTRGRLVRVAATGFAVLLGTGLVGCMGTDKDKKDTKALPPKPGLPNTTMLPPGNTAGRPGGLPTSNQFSGTNQFGTGNQFGSGIQQTGGLQPTPGVQPRVGSNGMNNNTGGLNPQPGFGNYPNQPGGASTLGAPMQPNVTPSVLPPSMGTSNFGGAGVNPGWSGSNTAPGAAGTGSFNPPPANVPMAPLPPDQITPTGGQFAVQPPMPLMPSAPFTPNDPAIRKGYGTN